MKKLLRITALNIAFAALLQTGAMAATAELYDATNGVIKISGTVNAAEEVKILITNPGYTSETAENPLARQYADTIFADAAGSYSQSVLINDSESDSGFFNVYVKEGEAAVQLAASLYFASTDEKGDAVNSVSADTSLVASDEEIINIFGLTSALYKSINMQTVADLLEKQLTKDPISVPKDAADEQKLEAFNKMSGLIRELAVITAYNEGKSEVVFNGTSFNYDETMGMTSLDTDKNVSVYKLYTDSLSDTGKAEVQKQMLKKDVDSIDELKRIFADSVLYYGISNNKITGYGHISDYITENNVCYALNVTVGNTPVESYLGLADKGSVNYKIKKNESSLTLVNYLAKIEEYAKSNNNGGNGGSNGGSTGGSSGGGGNVSAVVSKTELTKNNMTEQEYYENLKNQQTGQQSEKTGAFTDVAGSFWAFEAIENLAEKEIISGVGESLFDPYGLLTREQAVKIICEAFEIELEKNINANLGQAIDITDYDIFDDVTQNEWYSDYIFAAYYGNIANGVAPRVFGVGQNITREDVAVLLFRAGGAEADGAEIEFADGDSISDYAKDAIAYMKANGIINGYEDSTFKPKNNITRAEMAQIVYNMIK